MSKSPIQVLEGGSASVSDAAPITAVQQGSSNPTQSVESGRSGRSLFTRRTRSLLGIEILSTGSFVPDHVVTNDDLKDRLGFDPEWIRQRSGVESRRHAPDGMATSDMCVAAATQAIRAAKVDPQQIDLLIVGTFTPDCLCPSTANLVQEKLGLDAPAMDLAAACSGFMYSLVTAAQFVATGNAQLALVCGADTNSRILDPTDQRTYPLFGDGAGAVLLAKGDAHQGLICYQMGSDGSGASLLDRPAGGTRSPLTAESLLTGDQYLRMDGRSVFKWAVRLVTDTIELVLQKSGMTVDDVDCYILHQANIRIINAACEQLGIRPEKVFNNLQHYGNTSGGSIPIALDEALAEGRIQRGDTVLMSGFGAGLTWGTGLVRW
jgi:3-oxoacyl-[acyl-carrier-protein] synthase III